MTKYVVIGNSAAGISAVEMIRKKDKRSPITIISDEKISYYSRCLLPNYLAGEISKEKLILRDIEWYKKNGIKSLLGKKVQKIDDKNKKVILEKGESILYDTLLIATGSSPIFPSIPGINNPMVFGLRTLSDAENILKKLHKVHTAVVLGGGLVGLKTALSLWKRRIHVTIIEKLPYILPKVLDQKSANIVTNHITKPNLTIKTNSIITEIIDKNGIKGIRLGTGEIIKCDLVIVTIGVKTNIELIEGTSIKKGRGIWVDEYMRTNVEDVYAAGDVVETIDFLSKKRTLNAIWPSATKGGKIAGQNMIGTKKRFNIHISMNSIELLGIPIISMGIVESDEKGYEVILSEIPEQNIYKKLLLRNDKIVGMIFMGDIKKAGIVLGLIQKGEEVSKTKFVNYFVR